MDYPDTFNIHIMTEVFKIFHNLPTLRELFHLDSNSKVIRKCQFFKSGDRYVVVIDFFFTIGHLSFWVSEEKKELSPS